MRGTHRLERSARSSGGHIRLAGPGWHAGKRGGARWGVLRRRRTMFESLMLYAACSTLIAVRHEDSPAHSYQNRRVFFLLCRNT
jgi:hypothetical protein